MEWETAVHDERRQALVELGALYRRALEQAEAGRAVIDAALQRAIAFGQYGQSYERALAGWFAERSQDIPLFYVVMRACTQFAKHDSTARVILEEIFAAERDCGASKSESVTMDDPLLWTEAIPLAVARLACHRPEADVLWRGIVTSACSEPEEDGP